MRMVRRRTERCKRDGREGCEPLDEAVRVGEEEAEWDVKETVKSGTEGPWWVRIGVRVPSCDTCTPSYAGRGGVPSCWSPSEEVVGYPMRVMRVPRYRADDVREEGGVVSAAPEDVACCWDSGAGAAGVRSSALRSTPSTILEPEG